MHLLLRSFVLLLLLGGPALAKPKPKYTLQFIYYAPRDTSRPPSDNYSAVRAWLEKQDEGIGFPKEARLDLNGDGHAEVFLRVLERHRYGEYTIFTARGGKWNHIGYGIYSEPPVRLKRAHGGWHDFSVDVTGPRDQLVRRYFRWDPRDRTYDFSYEVTIRPMEQDEPGLPR